MCIGEYSWYEHLGKREGSKTGKRENLDHNAVQLWFKGHARAEPAIQNWSYLGWRWQPLHHQLINQWIQPLP